MSCQPRPLKKNFLCIATFGVRPNIFYKQCIHLIFCMLMLLHIFPTVGMVEGHDALRPDDNGRLLRLLPPSQEQSLQDPELLAPR